MTLLTIFLMSMTETDRVPLEEAPRLYGAQIVKTDPRTLARLALAAIARGPVICIAPTDREAGQALGLGIDEVLRAGEVTRESLASAVEHAQSRATARASPNYRHALLDQDDEAAFATLGAALGERLETPLAMAAVDCAAVTRAMNCLIDIDDQFIAWTALVAPSEQLRNLVARRLTAPTSPELQSVLRRLRASIGRAESLVRLLRELTRPGDPKDHVAIAPLLEDIVDVMRQLSPWSEISIHADPICMAATSRTTLIVVAGVLLANSIESIRAAARGKGAIAVRAFEEEDAVIVEIRDNGREIPSDLRPDVLEPAFCGWPAPRGGLPGVRDRLRRAGGELLVDSDPAGTTVRVFLPSAGAQETISAGAVTGDPLGAFKAPS